MKHSATFLSILNPGRHYIFHPRPQHVNHLSVQIIFALLFSIIISFPATSQDLEIKARVIDTSNFEPVAFSSILIDDYTGTITDELGFFRLRISPDKYFDSLHISCIGYIYTI